ncbi:MAG TPA: sensor histidine kinase [Chitinophagaceae bacterium]
MKWKPRLRGFSIQQRLPLLICVLLLTIMIIFGLISYFSVRTAALRTGRERLHSLSDQLSDLLSQSAQGLIAANHNVANHHSIKEYLEMLPAAPDSAVATMQKLYLDSASVLVELTDQDYRPVIRRSKNGIDNRINFDSLLALTNPDTGGIGKMVLVHDSIYYSVTSAITEKDKVIGHLVRWRVVRNTSAAIERITQLIGTQAKLYFGNTDNSLWTDLMKPISNPVPADAKKTSNLFEYYGDNHKKVEGVSTTIKNTPWMVLVQFSQQSMLLSANRFLGWVILIGSVLVSIGIFIAWHMSRNITRPLNQLTIAASHMANGNYSSTVANDRRDEVGKLARAFNAMAAKVNKANSSLEQKIMETVQMNEQLRELSAHLQNIREDERKHIAREMHDELGQFLTGLKMDIGWLKKKLPHGKDTAASHEKLIEMSTMVDEAVIFVRKLAAELRPSILDDLGLIAALEWHSQEFTRRFNIPVKFHSSVSNVDASPIIATGLFRMYQESLTNVARHAGAQHVFAHLVVSDTGVHLSIQDDGKGFDPGNTGERKTLGLLGMKERAAMIGGTLDIISMPGQGTTILINTPLQEVSSLFTTSSSASGK